MSKTLPNISPQDLPKSNHSEISEIVNFLQSHNYLQCACWYREKACKNCQKVALLLNAFRKEVEK